MFFDFDLILSIFHFLICHFFDVIDFLSFLFGVFEIFCIFH